MTTSFLVPHVSSRHILEVTPNIPAATVRAKSKEKPRSESSNDDYSLTQTKMSSTGFNSHVYGFAKTFTQVPHRNVRGGQSPTSDAMIDIRHESSDDGESSGHFDALKNLTSAKDSVA